MRIDLLICRFIRLSRIALLCAVRGNKMVMNSRLPNYDIALDTEISISGNGRIVLGSIVTKSNVHLSAWNGQLLVGDGCKFNRNDIVVAHSKIEIGDQTIIGPNVCIYDHDHEFDGNGVIAGHYRCNSINIGKNVWIGAGTIILKGASIGDNCVIGAGCVISGKIPSKSLVTSGNRILNISPLKESKRAYDPIVK